MPELPEVETIAANLRLGIHGSPSQPYLIRRLQVKSGNIRYQKDQYIRLYICHDTVAYARLNPFWNPDFIPVITADDRVKHMISRIVEIDSFFPENI